MAFSSSNLHALWPGDLLSGKNAGWFLLSGDTTATVYTGAYLSGVMKNSRGLTNLGVSTGDICFVQHGTSAFTAGLVTSSTADQSSTSASTGWGANFNGTLTAITGL